MGHGAAEQAGVAVAGTLESNDEIEGPPAGGAVANRDHAGGLVTRRSAHRAFVRVRRKEFERARRIPGIAEQGVNRLDCGDPLEVAVPAGVVVRPRDRRRFPIVDLMAGWVGLQVSAVEVVCSSDAAQGAERGAQVLMIPRGDETSTSTPKAVNGGALR